MALSVSSDEDSPVTVNGDVLDKEQQNVTENHVNGISGDNKNDDIVWQAAIFKVSIFKFDSLFIFVLR